MTEALVSDTGISAIDGITSNPALSGTGDPNAAVLISIDGGASVSAPTDATGKWTLTPVLADGTHTAVVTETDLAGNTGTTSLSFTLDTKAPPVTVKLVQDTGRSATDGITSNPALTGSGDPGAAVFDRVDGGAATQVATASATGAWTFTPVVADGTHTVTVTETDLAGNVGSSAVTMTVDRVAPAAPGAIGLTYTANATQTALTAFTISGTAEANAIVAVANGAASLGTAIASATGAWSVTVTPNPTSSFSEVLTITATDVAGNVSTGQLTGLVVGNGVGNALTATGPAGTDNYILGLAGADTLNGGSGNDTLDGGLGADTMAGGAGNDTYIVDNIGDVVIENPNAGTDTILTSRGTFSLATSGANVENLTYTGAASFTGTGNNLSNVITGGASNDIIDGGTNAAGVDTLIGGAGNDTYIIRNTGDVVTELAGAGTDTELTALASRTLDANVENLTYTRAGNFKGTGNNLANVITSGAGADTLDGGVNTTGADTLIGGNGNDTYIIRNVGDVVTEAAVAAGGTDIALVAINSYTLAANVENMTFIGTGDFVGTGNTGNNVITGGAGADILNGGAGNDTLIGGAGADTLTGGIGNDIFSLVKGDDNGDLITDFTQVGLNGTDQIVLSGYAAGATLVKTVTGNVGTPTSYAVQVAGVTQDTFKLSGNITLLATDFRFV